MSYVESSCDIVLVEFVQLSPLFSKSKKFLEGALVSEKVTAAGFAFRSFPGQENLNLYSVINPWPFLGQGSRMRRLPFGGFLLGINPGQPFIVGAVTELSDIRDTAWLIHLKPQVLLKYFHIT